jgi:hypothetical protein
LGEVTNEIVKCEFLPILLIFITFHLYNILFFTLHPSPKVLKTLQVVDFLQIEKSRGETLEQGSTFLVCFHIFVSCTDPFRVFSGKTLSRVLILSHSPETMRM